MYDVLYYEADTFVIKINLITLTANNNVYI